MVLEYNAGKFWDILSDWCEYVWCGNNACCPAGKIQRKCLANCLGRLNTHSIHVSRSTVVQLYGGSIQLPDSRYVIRNAVYSWVWGTAFAPNIQTVIFTLGIVAGFGAGLGVTPSIVVIGFNFKVRRDIALGVVLSGMGSGLFALAPLMQLANDYYGATGFFIIQAAISLNIIVFGASYIPSKLELHTQDMRTHNNRTALPHGGTNLRFIDFYKQYFKALNKKPIFLLSFGMFLNCIGTFLIYLHLPVYIVSKGFSKAQASYMMSLTGILTVIGRLLTGFVANLHKSIDIWLYSGSFAVVSVATIVYPHISNTLAGNIGYAVVLGLFFGCCYVLITSVNMSFVGIRHDQQLLVSSFSLEDLGPCSDQNLLAF
ncbi:monocarboxylate transporter 12-like isoform X2 [Ruditapes philippinarum]|uniref:monocarboxylate transporter 12-like isoform X2 n=1 Tax=Ruditapes philippinarum TaxID=129788 RepID=UPI00295C0917|nr:monocarboxylate transporter 12-like isoform X2 [Ruditapes philippinarum]